MTATVFWKVRAPAKEDLCKFAEDVFLTPKAALQDLRAKLHRGSQESSYSSCSLSFILNGC